MARTAFDWLKEVLSARKAAYERVMSEVSPEALEPELLVDYFEAAVALTVSDDATDAEFGQGQRGRSSGRYELLCRLEKYEELRRRLGAVIEKLERAARLLDVSPLSDIAEAYKIVGAALREAKEASSDGRDSV